MPTNKQKKFHYPGVRILSLGVYLPNEVVTNAQLAKKMKKLGKEAEKKLQRRLTPEETQSTQTSDRWIRQRTGIRERREAASNEATSDLGTKALINALERYGLPQDKLDFIIVATVTPDHLYSPPTACLIQESLKLPVWKQSEIADQVANNLELRGIFTVDVSEACTSFMAALQLGYSLIRSGQYQYGAVIGADKMSTAMNLLDRRFAPLLGDAGAALLLGACQPEETSFLTNEGVPDDAVFFMGSMGESAKDIICEAGGSRRPVTYDMLANPFNQPHKLYQDGKAVFKKMINLVYDKQRKKSTIIGQAIFRSGLRLSKINCFAFHQANLRMLTPIGRKIRKGGFKGRILNNINRYANTTSATIPLCLYTAEQKGRLKYGQTVALCAFGGGYSWGFTVIKWTVDDPIPNEYLP